MQYIKCLLVITSKHNRNDRYDRNDKYKDTGVQIWHLIFISVVLVVIATASTVGWYCSGAMGKFNLPMEIKNWIKKL